MVDSFSNRQRVMIGADFNGHVGEGTRNDEVLGGYGVRERKE